ncbi:MAG: hypothetical protein Q8N26_38365 [Myxococcales bacterium]|nr:hypothetical protein [Myxococcales bacterium]
MWPGRFHAVTPTLPSCTVAPSTSAFVTFTDFEVSGPISFGSGPFPAAVPSASPRSPSKTYTAAPGNCLQPATWSGWPCVMKMAFTADGSRLRAFSAASSVFASVSLPQSTSATPSSRSTRYALT